MNSLQKISYTASIEDIKNRTDHLLNLTLNISEKFNYKDFDMYSKIKNNINKIENIMKDKNFEKKVNHSKTLKILTSIHGRRELAYPFTLHGPIKWDMWDKYIDIIKKLHQDIKWENYSDLDVVLCVFLWCSNAGPNYYNKNIKKENYLEDKIEVPNMRPGRFGSIEFFITIDGYIKNSLRIPIELLQKINENTYHSFSKIANSLKYVEKNKITLIKQKHKNSSDIGGLKPDNYDDFCLINYLEKNKRNEKDWIEYYTEKGYLEKY
tara:strand:- start:3833 stop:4630 length:798 start_codon:yes stop_codon:yes gene_type:complete